MTQQARPPIVTILGHVDHGKTSLLDYIRKSNVASREHGGITQHIGAYQAVVENKLITFIDTPGHSAFEKMRSRGAQVADIAVLVVAVDDAIMPQTTEAIKHIQAAKVPLIVACNKIDLPGINLAVQMEKIKRQLADQNVLVEEYGGDIPIIQISAKTGLGVDKLLEMVLLVAELHEVKGDPAGPAQGVVIEANLDKFKGPIATLLIRNGTLKKGEQIILSGVKGKIRGLFGYDGKPLDQAGPSTPVEVLGLEAVPSVGAVLGVNQELTGNKKEIQSLIDKLRQQDTKVLPVIVKTDKQGSLEAIEDALNGLNAEKEHVKVISSGTGDISEADVKLAAATRAIILGFSCKIVPVASRIAETEHVLVRTYTIIYELLDELKDVVEGMLKVDQLEEIFGTAQVLVEFPFGKDQKIAGCKILEGQFTRGPRVRIIRDEQVVGESKIKSLKKLRNEVTKVEKGEECGIMFDPTVNFRVGDLIQSFRVL